MKKYYFIPVLLENAFKYQIDIWKLEQRQSGANDNVYVEGEYIESEANQSEISPTQYSVVSNMLNILIEKVAFYERIPAKLIKRTLIGFSLETIEGQIPADVETQFLALGVKKFENELDYQTFKTNNFQNL